MTADKPFFVRMALNSLFVTQDSRPIVRMTAREFMFGYATTLTSLGNTFLPGWIHFDKVGLVDRVSITRYSPKCYGFCKLQLESGKF